MPFSLYEHQPEIVIQDNALSHIAKCVEEFLDEEGIEIFEWPGQSPDLNPIDNLWRIIRDKVMAKKKTSATTELWNKLKNKWNNITPELCCKLMTMCPSHPKQRPLYILLII